MSFQTIFIDDFEEGLEALRDDHDYDLGNYSHSQTMPASSSLEVPIAASPYPARGRPSLFSSSRGFVKFIIGKGRCIEEFDIHKEHATFYSPALKAVLEGPYVDANPQHKMEHIEPGTFRLFARWIYSQNLELDTHFHKDWFGEFIYTGRPGFVGKEFFRNQTQWMVKLWVLARELSIPRLQNQVMRYLYSLKDFSPWPLSREAAWVYENTSSSSPLRQLLVHVGVYCVPTQEHEMSVLEGVEYPQEYMRELLVICHRRVRSSELSGTLSLGELMVETK